jgi:hypothetical protein
MLLAPALAIGDLPPIKLEYNPQLHVLTYPGLKIGSQESSVTAVLTTSSSVGHLVVNASCSLDRQCRAYFGSQPSLYDES